MTTTQPTTFPLAPLDEVNDLSRRYATLKARLLEIAIQRSVMGLGEVASPGITISSRFVLRMLVLSAEGPLAELNMAPGDPEPNESWIMDGTVITF